MAVKKRPKLHNFSPSKEHIYKYKAVKNCFPPSEIPPTYLFLLSGSWTEAVVIPSSDRSTRINRISRIPKTWEHLTDWKTLLLWRISVIVKKKWISYENIYDWKYLCSPNTTQGHVTDQRESAGLKQIKK